VGRRREEEGIGGRRREEEGGGGFGWAQPVLLEDKPEVQRARMLLAHPPFLPPALRQSPKASSCKPWSPHREHLPNSHSLPVWPQNLHQSLG
jgi:hypothetical protein